MSDVPPSVDGSEVIITKYIGSVGQEVIFCRSIESLSGIASIDAATWTIKFRHRTSVTVQSHTLKVHLYILKSDGSLRQDLGIVTLGSWANHNTWVTRTINYAFGGYTVVDPTDYFAVDWSHKSVGGAGYNSYFMLDSPNVADASNSQITNWTYTVAVTIGNFQAPSTAYAMQYFFLNATITHYASRNNFVNATVEMNNIILKWINSTNTFSILQDTNGYCVIDASGCIKTNLNGYSVKLSWKIYLRWNCTEGYKSVVLTNTIVWDDQGHYGQGSQSNLFYFEDDLIINSANLQDPDRVDPSSSNIITAVVYYEGTTTAPYNISGITVYLKLNGAIKSSNSTLTQDGETTLPFTAEATTNNYSYVVYAMTDEPSTQNKTVAMVVDRVNVHFTVDDIDVLYGTTVNFTASFESEYDNISIPGIHYSVTRNGTLWKDSITTNFTDVQNDYPIWEIYNLTSVNANNWNLTEVVSYPAPVTVLWYGLTTHYVIASFNFTPSNPEPAVIVFFDASMSNSSSPITDYDWDFGDLSYDSGITTTHSYLTEGNYTVKLIVTSAVGTATFTQTINVGYHLIPFITARFTFSPSNPQPNATVTFDGTLSNSSSPLTSYFWDFGDLQNSTGMTVMHNFTQVEIFTVTLTVTSSVGSDSLSQNVTIGFFITAVFNWIPANPPLNTTISFNGTLSNSSSPVTGWNWDFGDGNVTSGNSTIEHSYMANATFLVTLTVANAWGSNNLTLPVIVGWGANHTCPTVVTPPETVVPQFFPTMRLDLSLLTTDLSFFWWQSTVTAKVLVINKATVGTDVTFTWKLFDAGRLVANGKQAIFISGLDKKEVDINIPAMPGNYTLKIESVAPVTAEASQSLSISQVLILGNIYHFFAVLILSVVVIAVFIRRRRK